MPGSRLSFEERERVATGLRDGLSYAEIGRQLGRPTSTISREVVRNGGHDHYRADRADHATRQRRQRPGQRRAEDADGAPADPAGAFEDRFATMMERTGLPRMPAHILACLLTSAEGELEALDLVRRLQVSPASVSKAVAYLESLQLIRRERDVGRRRQRYVVDDDMWFVACARVVQVCAAWAAAGQDGADTLGDTPAGERMREMGRYFEHVGRDLQHSAGHWKEVFEARRRAGTPTPPDVSYG